MEILFILFAAIAVAGALNVILQRNPIYSAIGLIVTLCALAGLFLTLAAQFIAAIQIIVYAGAIMVLFVFVIMLLNIREEESKIDRQRYLKWLAAPLFVALLAEVYFVIRVVSYDPKPLPAQGAVPPGQILGTVESIGNAMFTTYLLPFEATSVLILMAIVGSMLLARRERTVSEVTIVTAEQIEAAQLEREDEAHETETVGAGH
ncbi:MAG: NADH-quinone oxidoreductase subunit J [Acidobacteria bacterium]|nr:NADH-quinone oxidoreductase subunit J [Acidobacteriota bacterium]MCW5967126.1 NADH-quinone oxidoreductase subunit J [Blastocatellales bacterium]